MKKDTTNITKQLKGVFEAVRDPRYTNIALFSCYVNGEATAAIVAVTRDDNGDYLFTPLFVAVTPGMVLTDHDGKKTSADEGVKG